MGILAGVAHTLGLLLAMQCHHGCSGLQLFQPGTEYLYSYFGLFTTGTEQPVSYASSYMLIGGLRIQGQSESEFTARLEDLRVALYNGRWSYFPIPQFGFFDDERLRSLEEPFRVTLGADGRFKMITMNDQEPEFASNLKRGLASYLQMNLTSGLDSIEISHQKEMTTMGECLTTYEVIPNPGSNQVKVGKFRNHVDCPDIPRRIRQGTSSYYACSSEKTRDLFNSTSYATYDMNVDDGNVTINKVTVFSSILYWPFTSGRQYLYTWFNVTLALMKSGPTETPISLPENPENHEELTYVFEQSDYQQDPEEESPDLKTVEPFYFHQPLRDLEPSDAEILVSKVKEAVNKVVTTLNTSMNDFGEDFHHNSPLDLSKLLSYLDHDSLKSLYEYYSENAKEGPDKATKLFIFIDGLIIAGTSSTSTVLGQILVEQSDDPLILKRILPLFSNYVRTPSEALVKEFENVSALLKNPKLDSSTKTSLELSLATLVSRGCERNLCSTTKLLDKYIDYFETKLRESNDFGEQSTALLGLRNLRIGKALDKVLDIALGRIPSSNIVRVHAIWSLRPWIYQNPGSNTKAILRVFYNRTESCEVRASAFGLIMSTNPDQKVLLEVAYSMWFETCPNTLNIVRSTLTNLSKSVGPCSKSIASYARTILHYLPPGDIDTTRTTSYAWEYFDESSGFGKNVHYVIHKAGNTALPVSIYLGDSHTMVGYSSSPTGIFVRMEGLGKLIPNNLFKEFDPQASEDILKILRTLQVPPKIVTPLRLELAVIHMERVIFYYAADEATLRLSFGKALKDLELSIAPLASGKPVGKVLLSHSAMITDTFYQQPLEIGLPMSIYTSGTLMNYGRSKTSLHTQESTGNANVDLDLAWRTGVFGITAMSNHFPPLGTIQTVGLHRTLRVHRFLRLNLQGTVTSLRPQAVSFYPPSATNPSAIQTQATAFTSLTGENPVEDNAKQLLERSCPTCQIKTPVSSGRGVGQTKDVLSIPSLKGLRAGVKKMKCERTISKSTLLQRMQTFFSEQGKNTGLIHKTYTKFVLGIQQAMDYFFYWPNPEPCGFQLYFSRNIDAPGNEVLEKIDIAPHVTFELDNKLGKVQLVILENNITLGFGSPSNAAPQGIQLRLEFTPETEGHQELHGRCYVENPKDGKVWVGCLDIENYASLPLQDPLGIEGDDEPSVNQSVTLRVGTVAKSHHDTDKCPNDLVDISILATAERSSEQKSEYSETSQDFSYILCQLEKLKDDWPKNRIPPTRECFEVILDQSKLRKINLTVTHRVAGDIKKRWSQPLLFIGNLLSPFSVDPAEVDDNNVHNQNTPPSPNEGKVELNINLRKQAPVMDIHFLESGSSEPHHYHAIDLELIPDLIRFQPVPSRFSPLAEHLYRAGFRGSCAVTSKSVVTFDNLQYSLDLPKCEVLIAADCSARPDFAVYAKLTETNELAVRITLRGNEISIVNNEVTLSRGGKVTFDGNGKYVKDDIRIKMQGTEIKVMKGTILFGVEVRYSGGHFVQVIATSRYRSLTCGLCGNFDSNSKNDLRDPKGGSCSSSSSSSIAQVWTLKTDVCETGEHVC